MNHTPTTAIGIDVPPFSFGRVVPFVSRKMLLIMSTLLKNLISCDATADFGQKGDRQMRNLVVTCQFGASSGMFSVTGSANVYTANMTIPEDFWEKHDKDADDTISAYKKELQKALSDGSFLMYGHLFTISELTDGDHESVYNKNTKHTILQLAQALDTDDSETAKTFLKRALQRQLDRKNFVWEAPKD